MNASQALALALAEAEARAFRAESALVAAERETERLRAGMREVRDCRVEGCMICKAVARVALRGGAAP